MQEIRIGGGPPANADPAMGQTGHGTYGHAGPAFPNKSLVRPHFVTSPDVPHLSPVEIYRKQHEVTTTVSSYSLVAWLNLSVKFFKAVMCCNILQLLFQ